MTEFRTWDQLSEVEQLQCTYSDAHKDAYGFRPRPNAEQLNSVEWLTEQISRCSAAIARENEWEAENEREAISRFEERVAKTMAVFNKDRETIIRWIADSEECSDDYDYLCYKLGVPYGYIKKGE